MTISCRPVTRHQTDQFRAERSESILTSGFKICNPYVSVCTHVECMVHASRVV